jgi:CheY-like chemotaxis protein/anti-sigma regulatory factor (Ser/Thr protein kinase)
VVEDVIETCRPAAAGREILLTRVINPDAGPVTGDPNRLQQVVWNLLTNAIKYTQKGGKVHVAVRKVKSHIEVTVADNGQGINPEFLPQLFRRFAQADSSTTRSHGGLGLGLAIVRHLVELHGGTVSGTSEGEGKGSTFTVNLPLTVVSHTQPASTTTSSSAMLDLSGVKVLVVDDEPDARLLVQRVLSNSGAEVTTAGSADEAYGKLLADRPDIILCDIGMPEQDGYELIQRIRSLPNEQGGSTPAVALTAFARSEDRRRALLAGFQLHVPKPAEPAELLAVVASISRINRRNLG